MKEDSLNQLVLENHSVMQSLFSSDFWTTFLILQNVIWKPRMTTEGKLAAALPSKKALSSQRSRVTLREYFVKPVYQEGYWAYNFRAVWQSKDLQQLEFAWSQISNIRSEMEDILRNSDLNTGMDFAMISVTGKLMGQKNEYVCPGIAFWVCCKKGVVLKAEALHEAMSRIGPWTPDINRCTQNISIGAETLDEMCNSLYVAAKDNASSFVQQKLDHSLALYTDDLPTEIERAVCKLLLFKPDLKSYLGTLHKAIASTGVKLDQN